MDSTPVLTWEALFRAQVALMRRFDSDDVFNSLTFREYDVLFTLRSAGNSGLRLRDLNKSVLLHQSALSRLVERMEDKGLVYRDSTPDDARGTVVKLTEQGIAAQRSVGRTHVAQIAHYVNNALTPAEQHELARLAQKLRAQQEHIAPFDPKA